MNFSSESRFAIICSALAKDHKLRSWKTFRFDFPSLKGQNLIRLRVKQPLPRASNRQSFEQYRSHTCPFVGTICGSMAIISMGDS